MASISYIFGDALNGQIIEEIRLTSVSMNLTLDGGEFRATFHLDQSGKTNESLVDATIPGRTYVVVERDGQVVGDFIVWTRTYQSQAKVFQIYAIPWKDYTESRIIQSDYFAADVEQRNIVLDLYALMQEDDNSLSIELPPIYPDEVLKSVEVGADEYKTYRQVIDSISDTPDGFDWLVRTERVGNYYRRWLDIGYPQLGTRNTSAGTPVFSYVDTEYGQGGNIVNYWCNDSMGSAATHFYGLGSGEGTSMVVAQYVHTNLVAGGFPRYDATVDRKDIFDEDMLAGVTALQAELLKAPVSTITAEVKADSEPPFGGYGVGDTCIVEILDPRFPEGFRKTTRVLGIEYYPPEDSNIEFVRLKFEGEDQG